MKSCMTEDSRRHGWLGHLLWGLCGGLMFISTQAAHAQSYGGESFGLKIESKNVPALILDSSGLLPANGGLSQNSLLDSSSEGIAGRAFYAMSEGGNGATHSGSFVGLLDISTNGHRMMAQFVIVDAYARNGAAGIATSGGTTIAQLSLDGQLIAVSGAANQMIQFPDGSGYLVINEQQSSGDGQATRSITVNGLHLVIPGKTDIIACSSRAAITNALVSLE
jgi:hypothetical protein